MRFRPDRTAPFFALMMAAGCNGPNTAPTVVSPGREPSIKTRALNVGAKLLQDRTPIDQVRTYVCGFHFYSGDMTRQVEAHHYCIPTNDELMQCLIFSGNGKDAKLIGVEYIISARLFEGLPDNEWRYWHSHDYEIKSGTLTAPGLPEAAEHALMEKLASTYGKTIHTWQIDRGDTLPIGTPQLMMAFTADGQIHPEMIADRDRRFDISTEAKRKARADIPRPKVLPGANAWERGDVFQLEWKHAGATKDYPASAPADPPREAND